MDYDRSLLAYYPQGELLDAAMVLDDIRNLLVWLRLEHDLWVEPSEINPSGYSMIVRRGEATEQRVEVPADLATIHAKAKGRTRDDGSPMPIPSEFNTATLILASGFKAISDATDDPMTTIGMRAAAKMLPDLLDMASMRTLVAVSMRGGDLDDYKV